MNLAASQPLAHYFGAASPPVPAPPVPTALEVTSSTDHVRARAVLVTAWHQIMRREPTLAEIQSVQAIALHETGYGRLGPFPGSHNWGAVQIPGTSGATQCPDNGLLWRDSHPRPDGTDEVKAVCFRTYPSDVAGAGDVLLNVTKRRPKTLAALATGDVDQIAAAMYAERYYEGHGATPAARVAGYAKALERRAAQVAKGLGEPLVAHRAPPPVGSSTPTERGKGGAGEGLPTLGLPLAALLGILAVRSMTGDGSELPAASGQRSASDGLPSSWAGPRGAALFADHTEAGDLLPTFVTPDDARRYVNETDSDFQRLDHAIRTSTIDERFEQSWTVDFDGWRQFRDDALKNVGWLNTKATMDQTDRWKKKVSDWHENFTKSGGQAVGPAPTSPGQGVTPAAPASAGWVQLALLLAGVVAAGYLVRGFRGVA